MKSAFASIVLCSHLSLNLPLQGNNNLQAITKILSLNRKIAAILPRKLAIIDPKLTIRISNPKSVFFGFTLILVPDISSNSVSFFGHSRLQPGLTRRNLLQYA